MASQIIASESLKQSVEAKQSMKTSKQTKPIFSGIRVPGDNVHVELGNKRAPLNSNRRTN